MHAVGDYVIWIDAAGRRRPARIDETLDRSYYVIRLEGTEESRTVHESEFSRA